MALEFISGPVMYARVFENNRDLEGYEGKYKEHDGMYTVCIGVPEYGDDYKRIMGWNRMYAPKIGGKDKGFELDRGAVEGMAYFTFKRKHTNPVRAQWGGAPQVVDVDRQNWDSDTMIGNGSTATIKLDVEKSKNNPKITFVRLEGLLIEELVPYERLEVDDSAKTSSNNLNDDIPF